MVPKSPNQRARVETHNASRLNISEARAGNDKRVFRWRDGDIVVEARGVALAEVCDGRMRQTLDMQLGECPILSRAQVSLTVVGRVCPPRFLI